MSVFGERTCSSLSPTTVYYPPCICGCPREPRERMVNKKRILTLSCQGTPCTFSGLVGKSQHKQRAPSCPICWRMRSQRIYFSGADLDDKSEEGFGTGYFVCNHCHYLVHKVSVWVRDIMSYISNE